MLLTKLDIIIKGEATLRVLQPSLNHKACRVPGLKDRRLQMHLGRLEPVEAKEHFDQFIKIEVQIILVMAALEEIQITALLQVVFKFRKYKFKTRKCLQGQREL